MNLAELATHNPDGLTAADIRHLGELVLRLRQGILDLTHELSDNMDVEQAHGRAPIYFDPDGCKGGLDA